jgi:hypothetical protein
MAPQLPCSTVPVLACWWLPTQLLLDFYEPPHEPTENTATHNSSIVVSTTAAKLMWSLLCHNLVRNASSD